MSDLISLFCLSFLPDSDLAQPSWAVQGTQCVCGWVGPIFPGADMGSIRLMGSELSLAHFNPINPYLELQRP